MARCSFKTENPIWHFLSHWYPVFLLTLVYMETGLLNQIAATGYFDPFFQNLDLDLFGTQPNVWLFTRFDHVLIQELLHFFYFSYYLMPLILGGVLYFVKRDFEQFRRFVVIVCVVFYCCYLIYIFLPVEGPKAMRIEYVSSGYFFVPIMDFIYAHAEKPGAAFPSSHVAAALAILIVAFQTHKGTYWVLLPLFFGLTIATVYCFYHYVIDIIFGILTGFLLYAAGNGFFRSFSRQE